MSHVTCDIPMCGMTHSHFRWLVSHVWDCRRVMTHGIQVKSHDSCKVSHMNAMSYDSSKVSVMSHLCPSSWLIDSLTRATWLIERDFTCAMSRVLFECVAWHIHTLDESCHVWDSRRVMSHSCLKSHVTFIVSCRMHVYVAFTSRVDMNVTWLSRTWLMSHLKSHTCDMTHLNFHTCDCVMRHVRHDLFVRVTCDSFMCVTYRMCHECDLGGLCTNQRGLTRATWLIQSCTRVHVSWVRCYMTQSRMTHDSSRVSHVRNDSVAHDSWLWLFHTWHIHHDTFVTRECDVNVNSSWRMCHVWNRTRMCIHHVTISHMTHSPWHIHVAFATESCATWLSRAWPMTRLESQMCDMTHLSLTRVNVSCRTYECIPSHMWNGHVTHVNESRHTHERVMSYMWNSHVVTQVK